MRIVTWNLDGGWTSEHERVLASLAGDVLLLTEVPFAIQITGFEARHTAATCRPGVSWAAVVSSSPMTGHRDPHPASTLVETSGVPFLCSVLPWPLSGEVEPWAGETHLARVRSTVAHLTSTLRSGPLIWGGDWNQPLEGNLVGFSRAGQSELSALVGALGLVVPTATLPGRPAGQHSIDHIAVPDGWVVTASGRLPVASSVSDHDAYWVDVEA